MDGYQTFGSGAWPPPALGGRLGNSGLRVWFVSTRPTRLHNRVQREPDPINNRVESSNPNTTLLLNELPEHDPGNLL
jgi:hypothetical protein